MATGNRDPKRKIMGRSTLHMGTGNRDPKRKIIFIEITVMFKDS